MKIDTDHYRHVAGPYMEDSATLPISFASQLHDRGFPAGGHLPYEKGAWQVIEAELIIESYGEWDSRHWTFYPDYSLASAWEQRATDAQGTPRSTD